MRFHFHVQGLRDGELRFRSLAAAAINARPALHLVADYQMVAIGTTFESGGRRGGGSWRPDSPDWLKRKLFANLDPRVGFSTGALFGSLTERGHEHQILEVTDRTIHLASLLPYAGTQQRHRPFARFTLQDRHNMRMIVRDYFIAAWREANLA